jgi:hypothetical protein
MGWRDVMNDGDGDEKANNSSSRDNSTVIQFCAKQASGV